MLSPRGTNSSGDFDLPSSYRLIDFIKKETANGYIDTGIVLDTDDFVIDFMAKPGINTVNDIWPIVSIYENGTVSGVHIDSNKKICATVFGLTLTSNVVIDQWSYYYAYHIRLTCRNGQATLYVGNLSTGTQEDTVTGSYVFSSYSTTLGIFGDVGGNYSTYTTSAISYVKITKANAVTMLVGAEDNNTYTYGLYNLNTKILIAGSVSFTSGGEYESIGYGTFTNNALIESIDLNNSYYLGSTLSFANCINLENVTNFGYAEVVNFYRCRSLTNVPSLPNSVTTCNFSACNGITAVDGNNLPSNLIRCEFESCSNLTDVSNLPNSITSMSFNDCYNLVSIDSLPNNLTSLADTFRYCNSLTNIPAIPNSVTNMYNAFQNSSVINSPAIPDSVTDLRGAFSGCSNLVCVPSLSNNVANLISTFSGCTNLVNAPVIPNSVTTLYSTFGYCSNLVNAPVIPNSVTNMQRTFFVCHNLADAPTIPDSVTDMSYTFYDCTNLVNGSDIPNSVVNMYMTFISCHNLTGTMNIYSSNVTNASGCFQIYTTRPSTLTVHVPANSTTYNTFLAEGYNDQGTKDGVILLADL